MAEDLKDYNLTYNTFEDKVDGKVTKKLSVVLHTEEFGNIESNLIDGVNDVRVNTHLHESLADELIDQYEFRLAKAKS